MIDATLPRQTTGSCRPGRRRRAKRCRAERETEHFIRVTERSRLLPGCGVPQEDVAGAVPVAVAAGEELAVRGEGDGPDVGAMALEFRNGRRVACHVPYLKPAIADADRELPSVRRERPASALRRPSGDISLSHGPRISSGCCWSELCEPTRRFTDQASRGSVTMKPTHHGCRCKGIHERCDPHPLRDRARRGARR
jgi:hypothetical protein